MDSAEKWFDLNFEDRRYIGIEDVRIFNDVESNDLLFIGTGYHKNDKIGIVTGKYDIENFGFERSRPFAISIWLYIICDNLLHIICNYLALKYL